MHVKIVLLALFAVVQSQNYSPFGTSAFLQAIQGNNGQLSAPVTFAKVLAAGPPAQRLPVSGFGHETGTGSQSRLFGTSFSNPPPPPGSGQDPATQTCGLAPAFCVNSRYRSIDGSCNNLANPAWGVAQTPYARLTPYNYGDGVSAFPRSVTGGPLPNPRSVSLQLSPDKQLVDPIWNLNAQQWGQIITHDMSLTAGVAQTHKDPLVCCDDNGQIGRDAFQPRCAPILIPPNDPIHASQGTQCFNFVRTTKTGDRGCRRPDRPSEPLTVVTAYMDLSLVYGSSMGQAVPLRAGQGGRLLTILREGREWPPQDPNITLTCESAQSRNEPCYLTGDIRTNQSPHLALLQTVLLREHNRIADVLSAINPHWNDETLYQEARRIHIAEFQHINYYEYLPIFLGLDNMVKNRLIYPGAHGYVNDYNPNVDPSILDEHATAAFRHFHTLIRGYLQLISEKRELLGAVRLSDWFNRPLILEIGSAFEDLARGLVMQPNGFSDQFWTTEITQFLFKRNNTFGGDLRAVDIQRGRDHGLGPYVMARAACGLPVPKRFEDMRDFMSEENILILESLYASPQDVDLVIAGSLERNVPGAQAGPTFLCILTEQFYRTRVGDRYFYENGADPSTSLSHGQLHAIRKGASMSRLLCDNVDGINFMQPRAFEQLNSGNKLVPCDDLPVVDLTHWKDHRGFF